MTKIYRNFDEMKKESAEGLEEFMYDLEKQQIEYQSSQKKKVDKKANFIVIIVLVVIVLNFILPIEVKPLINFARRLDLTINDTKVPVFTISNFYSIAPLQILVFSDTKDLRQKNCNDYTVFEKIDKIYWIEYTCSSEYKANVKNCSGSELEKPAEKLPSEHEITVREDDLVIFKGKDQKVLLKVLNEPGKYEIEFMIKYGNTTTISKAKIEVIGNDNEEKN